MTRRSDWLKPSLAVAAAIVIALGVVAIARATGSPKPAPTTETVYRVPPACTRAALHAAQAETVWRDIYEAQNIVDQAALDHATFREFRQLILHVPARPATVDLAACSGGGR